MAQTKAQLLAGKSDQSVTFNDVTASSLNGGPFGGRNRIINGDMRIDQRNAGAAVTPSGGDAQYTLDRWRARYSQASKYSVQQVNDAPAGFTTSLRVTSLSAYSVAASDFFAVEQIIEGYNFADLAFGSASASSVTLSFWVKSSLTGTFGGSLAGAGYTRSYPFTYTISAANTWERKTISLSGDTGGTYNTTNAAAMEVFFGFGVGSNLSGTAGSWLASGSVSATGATSVVGTNGATFYLTGVQVESGSTSTPYERRSFTTELQLCQRYYEKSYAINTKPGTVTTGATTVAVFPAAYSTYFVCPFQVSKRTTPTMTAYSPSSGAAGYQSQNMASDIALAGWISNGVNSATVYNAGSPNTSNYVHFTAEAEL